MKELVEFMVKSLVDNPDNLVITTEEDENDIGKIIGKQGKIAKAIRTIVRSSAMKLGKKVIVEIN